MVAPEITRNWEHVFPITSRESRGKRLTFVSVSELGRPASKAVSPVDPSLEKQRVKAFPLSRIVSFQSDGSKGKHYVMSQGAQNLHILIVDANSLPGEKAVMQGSSNVVESGAGFWTCLIASTSLV